MALAVFAVASAAEGRVNSPPQDPTCDGKSVAFHQHRARSILKNAYASQMPRPGDLDAYHAHKLCIRSADVRARLAAFRDKLKRRLEQRIAAVTPYSCGSHGRFAIPCYIVARESGFNPRAENPVSSAGGYYQILNTTWAAVGGQPNGCYHVAACASPTEQHEVAARLWAGGAGASHWAL